MNALNIYRNKVPNFDLNFTINSYIAEECFNLLQNFIKKNNLQWGRDINQSNYDKLVARFCHQVAAWVQDIYFETFI